MLIISCIFFLHLLSAQSTFHFRLADSAFTLTQQKVIYDLSYFSIAYPNGDVPLDRGVCTDVIIRAYRKLNIDLQKLVHDDMRTHFSQYPHAWGLSRPDKNIDHRRVPNLMTFLNVQEHRYRLPIMWLIINRVILFAGY